MAFNNATEDSERNVNVQLLRSNKTFSRKAIVKLEAVAELSILIALTDSLVTIHDIDLSVTNFPIIESMKKTYGASTFALDVTKVKSENGNSVCIVRLVVAVKRKLQLYYWKNRKFLELQADINLPDNPKSLAWIKNTICVAYRSEYSLVKLNSEMGFELKELFPTTASKASITSMSDSRFALGKDEQTAFVDVQGGMAVNSLTWSEPPKSVSHDPPFLVACLNNSVEVRTESPKMSIQNVPLSSPMITSTVSNRPGIVYVASSSTIWCLKMVPIATQIPHLLAQKHFELALTLTNICENNSDEKVQRLQQIQILYAFHLFCHKKFKEAMDLFFKLDVDASHVTGLYPELFPSEYRNQLKYPEKVPHFEGCDLENGYAALVEYLTSVRHKLQGSSANKLVPLPMTEGSKVIKNKKQIMQILDTTLLKCYLKINDSLVASLLRLKSNHCHPEETERALRKVGKFSELIIFYNTKGLHKEALQLLAEQSDIEDSPLHGTQKTVQYLQNLGAEEIDLVCEYAGLVLDINLEEGLSIFTDDLLEVEMWPRGRIFDFLRGRCKEAVIPYLEHIITNWNDTNALFHNDLVLRYKENLVELFEQPESEENFQAISNMRRKLCELLNSSKYYTAETILPKFPPHCLHEERALLLGSIGRHKEALTLYLYQVKDVQAALNYCARYENLGQTQVYTTLYQLLVCPPDPFALKAMYVSHLNAHADITPDIKTGLKILEDHGTKIDLKVVLMSTPPDVPLVDILPYLESSLEKRVSKRHQMQLLKGLMHADFVEAQETRIELESEKIEIDEDNTCPVCFKRFRGQSAIVRFPDGRLVHYSCQERALLPPSKTPSPGTSSSNL